MGQRGKERQREMDGDGGDGWLQAAVRRTMNREDHRRNNFNADRRLLLSCVLSSVSKAS